MSQSARVEPTSSVRCGGVVLTGHRSLNKFVKGSSILRLYGQPCRTADPKTEARDSNSRPSERADLYDCSCPTWARVMYRRPLEAS